MFLKTLYVAALSLFLFLSACQQSRLNSTSIVAAGASAISNVSSPTITFTTQPQASLATANLQTFAITLKDKNGNPLNFPGGTLCTLSANIGSTSETIGGTYQNVKPVGSQVSFTDISLHTAGSYILQSHCTEVNAISSSSSPFVVSAGILAHVSVLSQPSTTLASGQSFGASLSASDTYFNPLQTGTVTIAITSGSGGTLNGVTTVNIINGLATFSNLSITATTAGPFVLSMTTNGSPIKLPAVTITPGASATPAPTSTPKPTATPVPSTPAPTATPAPLVPTSIIFSTQPKNAVAGTVVPTFTVMAKDQNGNTVNFPQGATCGLTASSNSGGLIGGTYQGVATSGSQATFNNLVFQKAGAYVVQASCTGVASPSANSTNFTIAAAAPSVITLNAQPPATVASGQNFIVTLNVSDAFSNPVQSGTVNTQLSTSPANAILGGTLSSQISQGTVGFGNLNLTSNVGGSYALTFSIGNASVTTSAITVTPAVAPTPPPPTITVNQASPNTIFATPGQTFNIQYSFNASGPTADSYIQLVQVIDGSGNIFMQNDFTPSMSTQYWNGNETFSQNLTVPPTATVSGTYNILVGLYASHGEARLPLTAGPGVTSTGDLRYQVATLNVVVPPVIQSFTASPTSIASGGSTTLSWNAPNATSIFISNAGTPAQTSSGSIVVQPTQTTTYNLQAQNIEGSASSQVTVTVNAPPPPPVINSFLACASSFPLGYTCTINWYTTQTTSVSLDYNSTHLSSGGGGNGAYTLTTSDQNTMLGGNTSGSVTLVLTATNSAGVSVTQNFPIQITAPILAPVITSFAACNSSVTLGTPCAISWQTQNAYQVSLTSNGVPIPSSTNNSGQGSYTLTAQDEASILNGAPQTTTNLTLTAINSLGASVSANIAVTILGNPPVISLFQDCGTYVAFGTSCLVTWSTSNADTVTLNFAGEAPLTTSGPGNGSYTITPTDLYNIAGGNSVATALTLTATNSSGSIYQNITIAVNPATPAPTPGPTPIPVVTGNCTFNYNYYAYATDHELGTFNNTYTYTFTGSSDADITTQCSNYLIMERGSHGAQQPFKCGSDSLVDNGTGAILINESIPCGPN